MTIIEKLGRASQAHQLTDAEIEERVRKLYEEALAALNIRRAEEIKALREFSGVLIPEEIVQKAYETLITVGEIPDTECIRALVNATGYQPKVTSEMVQQGYQKLIGHLPYRGKASYYGYDRTEQQWKDLEELTRISVSEEAVQAGYLGYITDRLVDQVQSDYGSIWWHETGKAFEWLREHTKVLLGTATEAKVLEIYEELRNPERHLTAHTVAGYVGTTSSYVEIMKKTRVPIPEDILQDAYKVLLNDDLHGGRSMLELVTATGIRPVLSEYIVQEKYLNLLGKWEGGWLEHIQPLVEATGIKPNFPREQVQEVYRGLLRRGQVGRFCWLIECTGVEPEKDMRNAFIEYLCGLEKKEA